ncbi:MAG: hypothetical protein ABIS46_00425 [Sphingomicrobium sp.]
MAAALSTLPNPSFAAENDPCAALAGLVHQARNDFHSLKIKKFDSGICLFRAKEFRCSWSFPSDSFSTAEAQALRVRQCALALPGVTATSARKGETGFTLEDDLSLFVAGPESDMGNYNVRLRLVETPLK